MYIYEPYSGLNVSEPRGRYRKRLTSRTSGRNGNPKNQKTFVDLKSDFGVKKVFGDEEGKADLIRLLNTLIPEPDRKIKDLIFRNVERSGATKENRKVLYDIFCTDNLGRNFVIEMQNYYLENMLSRMEYYLAVAFVEEGKKGDDWDYELPPYSGVLLTSFNVDECDTGGFVRHFNRRDDETEQKGMNLMNFTIVELDKFTKSVDELKTEQDVFLFLLKNMGTLKEFPCSLDRDLYGPLFERARIANFNKNERHMYQLAELAEEKHRAEVKSGMNKGKREGKIEGKIEGKKEGRKEGIEETTAMFVKALLERGHFSCEDIADYTGMTLDEVIRINKNHF